MKRKVLPFILMLLVCGVPTLSAQEISVASFRLLENDLTANTHGTMEKDFNGETAALIKVVTTEQGFVFDGGMVGIVKVRQEVGEVFVYVPHGIKKISIKHPQLGVLRDYYFPIPIEKARTYELKLTTGKVETIVTRSASKQYVMFKVSPTNAVVELDGMPLEVVDGFAEKSMSYGTYDYRVSCANYHTEAGKITVSSAGRVEKTISLRPNVGRIDFRSANEYHGAHVYINGERVGQLPLKSGILKSGTYHVKVLKPLYKPFEQQVTVTDNTTTTLNVALVPNFADITFVADAECEIWIDGRQRGRGKCTLRLELGEYTVEVKRPSHRTVSDVVTVSDVAARTIKLSSPMPIHGAVDISSSPSLATVYVDGVEKGQTPLILQNILVGPHKLVFKKEGYNTIGMDIEITEGENNSYSATLAVKDSKAPVHANVSRKSYSVNGVQFVMIQVEGGTFTMGATEDQGNEAYNGERPAHEVTLSSYSIGETEVTQELWQAVMGTNPSSFTGNMQRPVEMVSWRDCQIFIKKLNQLTGKNFRLPTEAEWEYAARGGSASKGYKYSGGNMLHNVGWYTENATLTTHAVKVKLANELGIYDMSGNVFEWCSDWFGRYSSAAQTNPTGPSTGSHLILRGGCWDVNDKYCRTAYRGIMPPDSKYNFIGFRLAL